MTFAEEIEQFVADQPIQAVKIMLSGSYLQHPQKPVPQGPIDWQTARPILNYKYYAGYGAQECHDVYVWTPSRVIYVHQYDGATWLQSVPRNFS